MMVLTPITLIAWCLLTYCKDDPEKVNDVVCGYSVQ